MHRRISTYSSSYIIEYLKVDLSGGKRIELILKDLSPSSLLLTADRIRPHFLYDPRREIRTYRHILRTARDNTPQFYGAFESNDLERYWLFLERVSSGRLKVWTPGRMRLAGWLDCMRGFTVLGREPWIRAWGTYCGTTGSFSKCG